MTDIVNKEIKKAIISEYKERCFKEFEKAQRIYHNDIRNVPKPTLVNAVAIMSVVEDEMIGE